MTHTSPTALRTLCESLVLPVVQFLSLGCLPLLRLLLLPYLTLALHPRAGGAVAGLALGGFGPLALIVRQVGNSLGEGEQHLAFDSPSLGPGTTRPAAGKPGPWDEPRGRGEGGVIKHGRRETDREM